MLQKLVAILFCSVLLAVSSVSAEQTTLTLMTHDSFNVSKEVISTFENENNVKLRLLKAGDAGAALVQAILSKENPMADVFYGVDNTFLSRALKAGIFMVYEPPAVSQFPTALRIDPTNRLQPVDFGDVCLNYDKAWFQSHKIPPPTELSDLVLPAYKGLTVVQNPATSSPGLAFLLATIGRFGEQGYLEFWQKLKANDVLVAGGWEDAYFGHFTAASKGNRPIVVSYASSPPAAVYYSEEKLKKAPTAAVVTPQSAFRQVEFVGILKGCKEPELARKLVDFMLAPKFQEDIPLQMFVFPANPAAKLPEVFVDHSVTADQPVDVSPEDIELKREQWIEAWTNTVLR